MNGQTQASGPVSTLLSRLLKGEPLALSRAITAVENGAPGASALLSALQPHLGKAMIIGITGPPGAGKSTLIDALIKELRRGRKTVFVLAVDPSSPLTGGAILGDRIRMDSHTEDPGVFVRSLASRGHLGGLFRTVAGVVQVMDAAGPDFIIIETVGAGQSEVEIADHAHANIVVCAPGLGDDVQAIKAGILEIADILVVNKSDHPLAADTVRQLQGMLALRDPALAGAKIVSTTATSGEGIAHLADILEEMAKARVGRDRRPEADLRARRLLADAAAQLVRSQALAPGDVAVDALCDRLRRCDIDLDQAAAELLQHVCETRSLR